jgi:hypothetical protein
MENSPDSLFLRLDKEYRKKIKKEQPIVYKMPTKTFIILTPPYCGDHACFHNKFYHILLVT